MEFFILMISTPLFLLLLALFAVFVLARYPLEPAKRSSTGEEAPVVQGSSPAENPPGANQGPTAIA